MRAIAQLNDRPEVNPDTIATLATIHRTASDRDPCRHRERLCAEPAIRTSSGGLSQDGPRSWRSLGDRCL